MANFIDYEYVGKKADPTAVRVWTQNYETGEVETEDYSIEDYLYFYIDAIDEKKALKDIVSQKDKKVQKVQAEDFRSLKDGSAAKFYKDMGVETYESDIDPIKKVMLDNYGQDNQEAPEWNLALYDIETDVLSEQTFEEMRSEADREINAISVWYSKPNKFYNFTVVPPYLRSVWNYDEPEQRGNSTIVYFDNEKDMLEEFFRVTKKHETVALGAWNGDFFDTGYIFNRCKKIWNEKGAAQRMGRFSKIRKTKIQRGDKEELIIRPVGLIWYDCLDAYKKNGPELESFALNAVAEEEGLGSKIDFEGNFEVLYHGTRSDRKRFDEITPEKKKKKLIKKSEDLGQPLVDDLYSIAESKIKDEGYETHELETRIQMKITEMLEEMLQDEEIKEQLGSNFEDLERFVLFKKFKDTYRLFLDYSIQDTQILYDLEKKIDKFKTLMMLSQYNVSYFQDVFTTVNQVEQGITNFAHNHNKKVVIDREYDMMKQPYNRYVDKELLRIRKERDYKIRPDDDDETKRLKGLTSQEKIPGAHVLLPQVGLISFDEEQTPELAREFKSLKQELLDIEKELEQLDDED